MGFSDTATYLRLNDPVALKAALTPILEQYGFVTADHVLFKFSPSYTPLSQTPTIQLWIETATPEFLRVYSSHSGIFAIHDGDYIPILQRLSASLKTDAFEISVDDGDSISVLESDGRQSRLTGCHSYVWDEVYERNGGLKLNPGDVFKFRGIQFPYQALEVDATIIPELIDYDFGNDMQQAICDFEESVFGQALPSYYDFYSASSGLTKKEVFGYAVKGWSAQNSAASEPVKEHPKRKLIRISTYTPERSAGLRPGSLG